VSDVLGLPLHPLVVHAAVVLIPLVALGMVVAAASPTWAERLRLPLGVLAVGGAVAAVVARWSGQQLLARVPGSAELAQHVDVADLLAWFVVAFAVLVVGWAVLSVRGTAPRWLGWLVAVSGLAVTVWTVLAGHTGATSVWGDVL
jgi:hypothetical protein